MSMLSAPRPPAEQQVVEAVPEPADHDQCPVRGRGVADRPVHAVCRRRPARTARATRAGPPIVDREADPHEELVGARVVELLALLDVRSVLEQQGRHRRDDAALVGAGQDEHVLGRDDGGVRHDATYVAASRCLATGPRRGPRPAGTPTDEGWPVVARGAVGQPLGIPRADRSRRGMPSGRRDPQVAPPPLAKAITESAIICTAIADSSSPAIRVSSTMPLSLSNLGLTGYANRNTRYTTSSAVTRANATAR